MEREIVSPDSKYPGVVGLRFANPTYGPFSTVAFWFIFYNDRSS
jgi:hypothetical protein